MINGIPDHRLEEIELRLVGADHRPWEISLPQTVDDNGHRVVQKGSRKAMKRAVQAGARKGNEIRGKGHRLNSPEDPPTDLDEPTIHIDTMRNYLTLFRRTEQSTDEMLEFVAHAPDDIEDLLREVKTLRTMLKTYKEKSEVAIKELASERIASSRAETKIVDMRRAWRCLVKEMGAKP